MRAVDIDMDIQSLPSISHIKAHIDLKGLESCISQMQCALQTKRKEKKQNFLIVRERFTYMIYEEKRRGYVNIANIKSWEELAEVVPTFAASFNIDPAEQSTLTLKVDNITASGNFYKKVNLMQANYYFNNMSDATFPQAVYQYRRNCFPAAFIKTRQCGTVILHSSGRYCIVGAKNLQSLEDIFKWIYAHICKL